MPTSNIIFGGLIGKIIGKNKYMSVIQKLFDSDFVKTFFKKTILIQYPDFIDVKKVVIKPYKKQIWGDTYHVVIEFRTQFITKDNKVKELPIFCSAHSDEPRENVFKALKYLWEQGFSKGFCTIPHPLFFSQEFNATFYRGVSGHNLYHYIRLNDREIIDEIIPKVAQWFAKLHKLPVDNAFNFNPENSRLKTVIPGSSHILRVIKNLYPEHFDLYQKAYKIFIQKEEEFLNSTKQRWIVHGDAHPENIIKMGRRKIGVIDFTDLCLSDFARDLGSFLQQIEFMIRRKMQDEPYVAKVKENFLENYLKSANIELTPDLQARIDNNFR